MPTIREIIKIFDRPEITMMPKEERIQIKNRTVVISLRGWGRLPMSQISTKKMAISQRLINL